MSFNSCQYSRYLCFYHISKGIENTQIGMSFRKLSEIYVKVLKNTKNQF